MKDLVATAEILKFFGECSGLQINMQKTLMAPIACSQEDIEVVSELLPARISDFPITYLGLPLSITRLRKAHLQPLVDRVGASIPTWKSNLMNKAGD